jgi:hypothetical protein
VTEMSHVHDGFFMHAYLQMSDRAAGFE